MPGRPGSDALERGPVEQRAHVELCDVGGHGVVGGNRSGTRCGLEDRSQLAPVTRRVEEELLPAQHVLHGPLQGVAVFVNQ